MKFKHISTKRNNKISLLIVSQSSETKHINFSSLGLKIIIILLIVTFFSIGLFTINLYNSHSRLKNNYLKKAEDFNRLKSTNISQKNKINSLTNKVSQIESKIKHITSLENTVKNMVGIKVNSSSKSVSPSRGGFFGSSEYSTSDLTRLDDLTKLINERESSLKKLVNDVEKKLTYLDAKPNLLPVKGRITSDFGYRKNPFGRGQDFHKGLDIGNNFNTKIKAAGSGVVTYSNYNGSYGNVIIINHGYGYQSIYAHNNELLVKQGATVEKGETIAKMGNTGRSTGPHLHFEIKYNGKSIDPKSVINNKD
ncbi:M23 family metallopeptidase [Dethiothermospora halolimnae]|uniref:M23 family metallopeptidase n=1 Tax=Dethiothermospora halolimnae TaxID=3114390 RepID=UPI003CCBE1CC